MSSSWHHILAISLEIYRVIDTKKTVNTSTSPQISDQLGTENACKTVMLIYRYDTSSGLQSYVSVSTSSDLSTTIRVGFDSLPANGSTRFF